MLFPSGRDQGNTGTHPISRKTNGLKSKDKRGQKICQLRSLWIQLQWLLHGSDMVLQVKQNLGGERLKGKNEEKG